MRSDYNRREIEKKVKHLMVLSEEFYQTQTEILSLLEVTENIPPVLSDVFRDIQSGKRPKGIFPSKEIIKLVTELIDDAESIKEREQKYDTV